MHVLDDVPSELRLPFVAVVLVRSPLLLPSMLSSFVQKLEVVCACHIKHIRLMVT
jgi:hypothetical protein